ncbi:hypothetical protein [Bacillus sp. D386]|uniref:hypothetical protein n=1 Tax=Bacillus sp. D386 TaxID=2587155 RepID=UPI00111FCF5A|nr:hypothetical protein [Bacillus sp. D386]
MYRNQIALVFSDFGLDHLYLKFEVPLEVHGILNDPETCEIMEQFLSVYDFNSQEPLLFDEFFTHFKIFKRIITFTSDLPIHYIDLYKPSSEISY